MQKERPLSPHLQVYRPQLTSMLSILHRGTGVFLMMGAPILVCWLAAIASGPQAFEGFQSFANHWFITLLMLGWTFALFYHLGNGIRHLFWDVGQGFELESLYKSGWLVLLFALLATAGTWFMAMSQNGGMS